MMRTSRDRQVLHPKRNQRTKVAASELAAFGSTNAGQAFDRDMLRGSTGGTLIDNSSFRNEGRANFSKSELPLSSGNTMSGTIQSRKWCHCCPRSSA